MEIIRSDIEGLAIHRYSISGFVLRVAEDIERQLARGAGLVIALVGDRELDRQTVLTAPFNVDILNEGWRGTGTNKTVPQFRGIANGVIGPL
jgi:hypothetical protein